MMGVSREFSRAAVPVWGFHEVGRGAQGASRVAPGKLGFNGRGLLEAWLPPLEPNLWSSGAQGDVSAQELWGTLDRALSSPS